MSTQLLLKRLPWLKEALEDSIEIELTFAEEQDVGFRPKFPHKEWEITEVVWFVPPEIDTIMKLETELELRNKIFFNWLHGKLLAESMTQAGFFDQEGKNVGWGFMAIQTDGDADDIAFLEVDFNEDARKAKYLVMSCKYDMYGRALLCELFWP